MQWCEYVYDFGDDWIHEVKSYGVHSIKETFKRRLLDGARACPPEDCGGPFGYQRCVDFLRTGKDIWDEELTLREWLGDWTPESFDFEAAKRDFDK